MIARIATLSGDLGRDGVERLVRSAAPETLVRVERRLYYPYFSLALRYAATTLFGRSSLDVSCFVDARTRLGATTDPFGLERVDADEHDVVGSRIGEAEARRIAERYTAYVLRNRRRAFVVPSIDVLSCQMVYKPFWIATCSPSLRVLVDGITGGFHVLSTEDIGEEGGEDALRLSSASV